MSTSIISYDFIQTSSSLVHDSVLVCLLHLSQELQYLHEILFEASEDALSVLASALVPVEAIHAVGDGVLRELSTSTTNVVMIDVHHAEFRLQLHGFGEKSHQLIQCLFSILHLWVIDEDDTMRVLLNGGPALFELEVSRSIPQLNVNLAEICNTWGRVSLEVHDPTTINIPHSENYEVSYLQPTVGL